jgi:hypothetical protein
MWPNLAGSSARAADSVTSLLSVDPDLLVIEPNDTDAQLEAAHLACET